MDINLLLKLPLGLERNSEFEILVVAPDRHPTTDYLAQFFKLRSEVFVHSLAWEGVFDVKGKEVDEYDIDTSFYILMADRCDGSLLAGLRVCPTHHEQYLSPLSEHPTSYMIRDAYLGRLEGIPRTICHSEPPTDQNVVELSRLISTHPKYLRSLIDAASSFLASQGVRLCLILASPTFLRIGRQLGYHPYSLGPVQETSDGRYQTIAYEPCKTETKSLPCCA